jgi:hypothetical protein
VERLKGYGGNMMMWLVGIVALITIIQIKERNDRKMGIENVERLYNLQ